MPKFGLVFLQSSCLPKAGDPGKMSCNTARGSDGCSPMRSCCRCAKITAAADCKLTSVLLLISTASQICHFFSPSLISDNNYSTGSVSERAVNPIGKSHINGQWPLLCTGLQAPLYMRGLRRFTALVTFPGLIICTHGGPRVVQREPPPPGHEQTWPQPLRCRPLC